ATSTYLVNKVTSYLDFIFAIACFLLDLTKPHCSPQLPCSLPYPSISIIRDDMGIPISFPIARKV
ncbi:hypothetical protein, partial [Nostoc sp. FACHB-133]|uniref:hypothetical protein n=1 Tax=Nostoc sp. FACHB-133 TaxID=2692835 RepID=UPI001A7EE755